MFNKTLRLSLFLLSASFGLTSQTNKFRQLPVFLAADTIWVDSVLKQMTLEEQIAQLLVPAIYLNDSAQIEKSFKNVLEHKPGGFICFKGGPEKIALTINKLQRLSKAPLLMSMDGEWGLAMRFDSTITYPRQMMIGALSNDSLVYQMAVDIAKQLKRLGLHTNFAPVADINNNPRNPVISSRSFGERINKVTRFGTAYMDGLQDNHILATAKHFPGHGDTETDSHHDLPRLGFPYKRIDSLELSPFKSLINNGVASVMVAHLSVPIIDPTGLPASLSPLVTKSILRDSFQFEGLIISDALNMKGVTARHTAKEITIKAFLAGCDILLMPDDLKGAIDTLKNATMAGIIPANEIVARCRRILKVKYWLGLNNWKPVETENLFDDLNKPLYELTRQKIIEQSVTVVTNPQKLLPLQRLDTLKIACIAIGRADTQVFQKTIALYSHTDFFGIGHNTSDSAYGDLIEKLKKYNLVIVALVNTDMRYTRKFGVPDNSIRFVQQIANQCKTILCVFGSPYLLERFPDVNEYSAITVSYEDKEPIQDASAQLLFGAIPAMGTLPVTASASASISSGTGIHWNEAIRTKYTNPEEIGIDRNKLLAIDSLVNEAIKQYATPGCIVYWAKDNKVFYHKAFGHYTYDSTKKVSTSTIYDLASITKIAATTPALMHLCETGKVHRKTLISKYLPSLKESNKRKIHIKDLLVHSAQLQPVMPLYLKTLECLEKDTLGNPKPMFKNGKHKNGAEIIPQCITNYKKDLYSNYFNSNFKIKVSDSLYVSDTWKDSLTLAIKNSKLLPKKTYKYSDLGFILLAQAIENTAHQTLDLFTDSLFFSSLGAYTLCFNPLERFSKDLITPTENDTIFRKQIVHGYVHDPTAALVGGVCGHAGLFATANDLGKMMHVFLNYGNYGGQQYFKPPTVELFTTRPPENTGNRRALGFDKPEPDSTKASPVSRYCSDLSFGHTGFTGTMTWVDPKYNLVFIFLSNRVYPNAGTNKLAEMNLRTKIQDIVYQEIIDLEK